MRNMGITALTSISLVLGVGTGWMSKSLYNYSGAYSEVEVLYTQYVPDPENEMSKVRYAASFKKHNGCELKDFAIIGSRIGRVNEFLNWRSLDNSGTQKIPYDRPAGLNTMDIEIDVPIYIDRIEIRSSHMCDGHKRSDRTFDVIDLFTKS